MRPPVRSCAATSRDSPGELREKVPYCAYGTAVKPSRTLTSATSCGVALSPEHRLDRIAGHQVNQRKHERRDAQQDGNGQQQATNQETGHSSQS